MTVGMLIANRRKELDLTLEDIGSAVGVSKSTVLRWENGEINKMSGSNIKKLAQILRIDESMLLRPNEVLFPGELELLEAWRRADDGIRSSILKLLDLK